MRFAREIVVNLSSIGGHNVYPTSAVYGATKFAAIVSAKVCARKIATPGLKN
jgi:NADP-dependent 3-hydroxy acid dehydrogenase YdfG